MRREVRNSSSGKKKPVWKIQISIYQEEGKGYLKHAGEHETGEDSVGKETEKSTREWMNREEGREVEESRDESTDELSKQQRK